MLREDIFNNENAIYYKKRTNYVQKRYRLISMLGIYINSKPLLTMNVLLLKRNMSKGV